MDPVLGRAADKRALASAGGRVALDRVAAGADEVEQLGELHDKVVVVYPVERVRLEEVLVERGLERPPGVFQQGEIISKISRPERGFGERLSPVGAWVRRTGTYVVLL